MESNVHTKGELVRINWRIVKRIVTVIHDYAGIKRTSIAMKSGLSYDGCVRYLNWMMEMNLVRKEIDNDGFELISLSDMGKKLFMRKFCDEQSDAVCVI